MSKEIDEMLKEISELKAEVQRTESLLADAKKIINEMAESIAMISNPIWSNVIDKEDIIDRIVVDYSVMSLKKKGNENG